MLRPRPRPPVAPAEPFTVAWALLASSNVIFVAVFVTSIVALVTSAPAGAFLVGTLVVGFVSETARAYVRHRRARAGRLSRPPVGDLTAAG